MSVWKNIIGIIGGTLNIGINGPKIVKASESILNIRDKDGNAATINVNKITGLSIGVGSTDAMPKSYIDAIGLPKKSVKTLATTNITLSGLQTVSGYALSADERVGVIGQTDPEDNGIYDAKDGEAWVRSTDCDGTPEGEVSSGMCFSITEGDYAGYGVILITPNPITVGTTELEFTDWEPSAASVLKGSYNANTILIANVDDTPIPLEVLEQRIVGRLTSGQIDDLTGTQVKSILDISGNDVELEEIGTATYDDVQDYINIITSSCLVSGGAVTDSGSGQIDIAGGTGYIKTTDSDIDTSKPFNFSGQTDVSLTDQDMNYVYVDYNSGSPQIAVTTDKSSINGNTKFMLAHVYRNGTSLCITKRGPSLTNFLKYLLDRLNVYGKLVDGCITTETGTRNIAITAGNIIADLIPHLITSKDTSGSDTFIYHYHSGGSWTTSTGNTQIDNLQYDNGTNLATLSNNKYGVFWVYMCENDIIHIVYGQGDYLLAEAENANIPSNIPESITELGTVIAKIIIQKSASSFTDISYPFDENFPAGTVDNHNDLGGLQGGTTDEYYHLTSAQHTSITGNDHAQNSDTQLDNGELSIDADDCVKINETAYFDAEFNNGDSGAAKTISWKVGNKQRITLTANCTFTFTAPSGPCNVLLKIIQGGSGSYTITWPSTVRCPGGVAPVLSTGVGDIDIISMYYDGTNYFMLANYDFQALS